MSGYHLDEIPRGVFGEVSKIEEEVAELRDAHTQGVDILELCELSDLVGAIRGYLRKRFPGMGMQDLIDMADVTERAFLAGDR